MNEWMGSKEDLLEKLGTDASGGLTPRQVETNRQRYGANRLTRNKPESMAERIRDAVREPMIIMLIMAWLIALGVNIFQSVTGGVADYLECVGIFVAILLSVIISVVMEGKSAKAFEALSRISDQPHRPGIARRPHRPAQSGRHRHRRHPSAVHRRQGSRRRQASGIGRVSRWTNRP